MMKFEPTSHGTEWLDLGHDDTYISYNPCPAIGGRGPETALVFPSKDKGHKIFLILDGDWRDAYKEAVNRDGFGGCLEVWRRNKATHRNSWTSLDDPTDEYEEEESDHV